MKLIKNLILIGLLTFLVLPICQATDLNSGVPANFPRQKATPKKYSSGATILAFYDKWAENIGEDIQIKTFDNEFIGVGYNQAITEDVFPKIIVPKTAKSDVLTCNLYNGILNANAYKKLKSPLLYDSVNNICVAAIAVRDYTNTENPYFEEPSQMRNLVSISGYFPHIPNGTIKLKEIALVPTAIQDDKKAEKYIKEVMKTYKNFLRAEELGVSYSEVPSKTSENIKKGVMGVLDFAVQAGTSLLQEY